MPFRQHNRRPVRGWPMSGDVGRPKKLTPEVLDLIVEATTRGSFAHVAAAAAGVSKSSFHAWMRLGEAEQTSIEQGNNPDPNAAIYLEFLEQVTRARSCARVSAESRVFEEHPDKWLRMGPGRDKPGDEGWAGQVKHEHTGAGGGPLEVITHAAGDLESGMDRLAKRIEESRADSGDSAN